MKQFPIHSKVSCITSCSLEKKLNLDSIRLCFTSFATPDSIPSALSPSIYSFRFSASFGFEYSAKGVANTGKKIGKKISETDKQIREKSKKTLDLVKDRIKKKEWNLKKI